MRSDLFTFLGEPAPASTGAITKTTYAVREETYDDDDVMPDELLMSTRETRAQGERNDDDHVLNHET